MSAARIAFGAFVIDAAARQLWRGGDAVHLSRKALDALLVLLDRRPDAVTKEELHARLWPGTFVSDANLSVVMAEVRKALGDDPQSPKFIRTVHRIGYAFSAEASDARRDAAPARTTMWLAWNDRVFGLEAGETVVGRDPACGIWLDVTGVSRRHARIVVAGTSATIEDLGSKNGTAVDGVELTTAATLDDAAVIRIGPVTMRFHVGGGNAETATVRLARG